MVDSAEIAESAKIAKIAKISKIAEIADIEKNQSWWTSLHFFLVFLVFHEFYPALIVSNYYFLQAFHTYTLAVQSTGIKVYVDGVYLFASTHPLDAPTACTPFYISALSFSFSPLSPLKLLTPPIVPVAAFVENANDYGSFTYTPPIQSFVDSFVWNGNPIC
jgi:hypothetical protein